MNVCFGGRTIPYPPKPPNPVLRVSRHPAPARWSCARDRACHSQDSKAFRAWRSAGAGQAQLPHRMSSSCEQCNQFRSGAGLLVRAFECEGNWATMPASTHGEGADASALQLPIERDGPGHLSTFYPPEYGTRLLALASSNSSDERVSHFNKCARHEVSPPMLHDGPWSNSPGPRPTSLLQESATNVEYATYANSFGFTLGTSTRIVGAHAFDAWTTKPRPACQDESQQAVLRLEAVRQFCDGVLTSESKPCEDSNHCRQREVQPRGGKIKLNSTRLEEWPPHIALSRMLAGSPANCRFKTLPSMLRQQDIFRSTLRDSGLLARCPYAWHAGAISQIASIYDTNDVTGIFVLDWVPSHLPLAALAFKLLPLQGARPLPLVRLSRRSRGTGQAKHHSRKKMEPLRKELEGDVTCSCHDLPWKAVQRAHEQR